MELFAYIWVVVTFVPPIILGLWAISDEAKELRKGE